uniref:4Fe-4S ferredoxin-type domain-containing protein n=2 Tax=Onchocerca TaxID=6281 RepID=A0A8R1TV62_ONCVO
MLNEVPEVNSLERNDVRCIMCVVCVSVCPCQREWVIRIPDRYVSNGAVARKIMDLGEMNLEVELEDEDQECIHL